MMDKLRTCVFVLSLLLVPVSCKESFFTEPFICYILDGVLIVYCIVATALFFKEKFSSGPSQEVGESKDICKIYQELGSTKELDPYQVLEPTKNKKKPRRKKKSELAQAEEDKDQYETLTLSAEPPPMLQQ